MSQQSIPKGKQSLLQTRTATNGKRFVVRADEKLTAFVELEVAIRARQSAQGIAERME